LLRLLSSVALACILLAFFLQRGASSPPSLLPSLQDGSIALLRASRLPQWTLAAQGRSAPLRVMLQGERRFYEMLKAKGVTLSPTPAGDIFAAWLRPEEILSLERYGAAQGLHHLGLSHRYKPHLNISAPLVGIPQSRVSYGLDGRGVIVGVVDSGIDLTHPAFRASDGQTRVLALLDFSLPSERNNGNPPRLFLKEEIDKALAAGESLPHVDTTGHGTHVAGIAAGNGGRREGQSSYLGMAPRADLVIVKALRRNEGEFDSGDILEGIAFIHQFAKFQRKPYVINLSLGGHQGAHDGSTFLERAIASYSGEGKAGQLVVVSAGNEGTRPIHWGAWLHPNAKARMRIQIPSEGAITAQQHRARVLIEIWSAPEATLSLRIHAPHQPNALVLSDQQQATERTHQGVITAISRVDGSPTMRRLWAILLANDEDYPLQTGRWEIELHGSSHRFDAWIAETRLPQGSAAFLESPESGTTVSSPGTSPHVITVGSFNARAAWQDAQGTLHQQALQLGTLSAFSSRGITRDQRPKPDLCAPGMFIAAPTSTQSRPSPNQRVEGEEYHISQGTSQAAPHVAGALALLLQQEPSLDLPTARSLLQRSAQSDQHTSQLLYQPAWGFGKLNLLAALQTLKGEAEPIADPRRSAFGALQTRLPADGKTTTTLYLLPKDRLGRPVSRSNLRLRIEDIATGRSLGTPQPQEDGHYTLRLTAPNEATHLTLRALLDEEPLPVEINLTFFSYPPPPPLFGCQMASSLSPSLFFLIFSLFLPLLFLRRKR
jgi:subtilisin family serine protease